MLTDHHVAFEKHGRKRQSLKVAMPNGKLYDAESRVEIRSKDIAGVAVKTRKDTDSSCQPAELAVDDHPLYKGNGKFTNSDRMGMGYPEDATPYASPGTVEGVMSVGSTGDGIPGEDANRKVAVNRANYWPGQSGGGVFNKQDKLAGLIVRSIARSAGIETPVTAAEIETIVRKLRR